MARLAVSLPREPPRPSPRRAVLVGTVVAMAALAASSLMGCSSSPATLDRAGTESAVGQVVRARVHVPVAATSCPASIRRARGVRIDCTVRLAGRVGAARVTVRQTDGHGTLAVVLRDAVIDRAAVTADLRAHLKAAFARGFQADCATGHQVMAPGTTFRCRARDRTGRRVVLVTVVDAAGTLRYRVLD